MADKIDFSNSEICDEKIKEILEKSKNADGSLAFRAIKHTDAQELKKEDFFPTIMERNYFMMPDETKQKERRVELFGVSVFDSFDGVYNLVQTVPTLRDEVKCYAKGKVVESKGTIGEKDTNGHYQYYLFEPKSNEKNPFTDFEYYKEENKDE